MMEVSDNAKGLALAVASSAFIGVSFILKKIGLRRAAKCGARAGTCDRTPCPALPGFGLLGSARGPPIL